MNKLILALCLTTSFGLMACSEDSGFTSSLPGNTQPSTPSKGNTLSCDVQTNFGGIAKEECSEVGSTDADKFTSDCDFNRGTTGTGCPSNYTLKCTGASGKIYYFYESDANMFGCDLMVSE